MREQYRQMKYNILPHKWQKEARNPDWCVGPVSGRQFKLYKINQWKVQVSDT